MVARANFIADKKADLDWLTPRPMPKGIYKIFYGEENIRIDNDNGKYRYICMPGFFSLIMEDGDPTITVSGDYCLDRISDNETPEDEEEA